MPHPALLSKSESSIQCAAAVGLQFSHDLLGRNFGANHHMDMTAAHMRGVKRPLLMAANLSHGAKTQLAGLTVEGRSGIPHQLGFCTDSLGISLEKTPAVAVVVTVNRPSLVPM